MAYLTDGYQASLSLTSGNSIDIISITPPGIDGGGETDITTMSATTWRQRISKNLKTLTESSATVAYEPAAYTALLSEINTNQLLTITFSDDSVLSFWGFLNNFQPGEMTEGERPTADITIIPTNQDNSGTEVAPTIT